MTVRIDPATAARFDDAATILAPKRAGAQGCWCLSYRLPPAQNDALRAPHRGEELRRLCGRPTHAPGVLAYDGDEVVGWAAIAPRSELGGLGARHFPHDPDDPWALTSFRVRAGRGRRGVARALLAGAVAYAADRGAPAVVAYPIDAGGAAIDRTQASAGLLDWFLDAGFTTVGDTGYQVNGHPRVIVRKQVDGTGGTLTD